MEFTQETTHFLGERGSINIQLTPGELTNRHIEIIIEWMSNQAENEKKDSAARLDINSPHDRLVEKFLQ